MAATQQASDCSSCNCQQPTKHLTAVWDAKHGMQQVCQLMQQCQHVGIANDDQYWQRSAKGNFTIASRQTHRACLATSNEPTAYIVCRVWQGTLRTNKKQKNAHIVVMISASNVLYTTLQLQTISVQAVDYACTSPLHHL